MSERSGPTPGRPRRRTGKKPARTAGYSATPLQKKLGIKEGSRVRLQHPPADFGRTLGWLPRSVKLLSAGARDLNLVLLFAKRAAELRREFPRLAGKLVATGMLWVAWPKKASGVETDLSFDVVQKIGLREGLVDVKVCAIDETWSGLKFVVRLRDRPRPDHGGRRG